MTKKRLFLYSGSVFFLITKGVFAWGGYDMTPTTYYTYNSDLPSIYDGYTLQNDNRMNGESLATYGGQVNYCSATVLRNLSLGSKGEDVATVQDYLFDQDFLQTQPNGYFGYATKGAVQLMQSRYGIRSTGTVGPETRNLINNLICGTGGQSVQNMNSTVGTVSRTTEIIPTVTTPSYTLSSYPVSQNSVNANISPVFNNSFVSNPSNQTVYPITVNRAPTVTIVIPLNKSYYKEGDTIPVTWVTSNMNANRYSLMLGNTSTGLEKQIAALPGSLKQYNVTLTKEILDAVCAGTTACTGLNANSYRMYVVAYYQTLDGELSIKAYADQITVDRPQVLGQVVLTPSKNPVTAGEQIKLYGYVPNTSTFNQYQNLYWKIRPICPAGITLTVNGLGCGNDIFVYQPNVNSSPDITVQVNGNIWGPTEVSFEATVLSYYGGQELGKATTKILVNK